MRSAEEEQVIRDKLRLISLLGLTLASPFVSAFLSPPCPSLLPSLLSFFHLISGLSTKLGVLQAKSFFLLYYFSFVFHCDTREMRMDFFFLLGFSVKKKDQKNIFKE